MARRETLKPSVRKSPSRKAPRGRRSAAAVADQTAIDWKEVVRLFLTSREIDRVEETELYPARKIAYQFSATGHELIQILLGTLLDHPRDAISAYYRSRPILLAAGLSIEDAFAGPLGRAGGYSDGRDIGVVCNLPSTGRATVLPMAGDVGSQFSTAAGWAEALKYHREVLGDRSADHAISAVLGGEGSVATSGFWSALTASTTMNLPLLFLIEDNGYAISVPSTRQTPGGDIAKNLASYRNLLLLDGDGTEPREASTLIERAVRFVRGEGKPALVRLTVPRLCGHSGQDTQAYKSKKALLEERSRDPLPKLKRFTIPRILKEKEWAEFEANVAEAVRRGLDAAAARPEPDPSRILDHVFGPKDAARSAVAKASPEASEIPPPPAGRINMHEAIRRTLETELARDPRLMVFGEDVGPKGGVHAVTLGLQDRFGDRRVFDTSLSEEGIIGRSVGMALAGLRPVPEIQFRKYADPATEQLNNCGTIRWRTANRFSAPIVVRLAGGFSRRAGDPWHSVTGESVFAHAVGWRVVVPSNAEDAVGLLRTALRSVDPIVFFEHRALLDAPVARRPYPGDDFTIELGVANVIREGDELTVVTWGGMVERCLEAADAYPGALDVIDLRTVSPWDKEAVLRSVKKTSRLLIVHEDGMTAGFGAEIAAAVAEEAFELLDAPVMRLAPADVPIPYHPSLMDAVLPTVPKIRAAIERLLAY